jgi:hypothetical protein
VRTSLKLISWAVFGLTAVALVSIMTNGTTVMNECELNESHAINKTECSSTQDEFKYESQKLNFELVLKKEETKELRLGFVGRDRITREKFSILQIEKSSLNFGNGNALVKVGQNKQPHSWQMSVDLPKTKIQKMDLELEDGKRLRIRINGELVYGFRWDIDLTPSFLPSSAEIVVDGNENALEARMIIQQKAATNAEWSAIKVFFLVLILCSLLIFKVRGKLKIGRVHSFSRALKSYVSSSLITAIITCITVLLGFINFFGAHPYFDRNGITYVRSARFSDWHQLHDLARFAEPYLVGNSQYPPAFLGMFKSIPFLATNYGLMFFSVMCPLAIGYLMLQMFDIRSFLIFCLLVITVCVSYPYLYALDRGSSELILVTVFVLFARKLMTGKLIPAAIFLGFLIGIKVFPIIFLPVLIQKRRDWIYPMISITTAAILTSLGSFALSGNGIRSAVEFLTQATDSDNAINQATYSSERSTSLFQWIHGLMEVGPLDLANDEVPTLLQYSGPLLGLMIFVLVSFFFVKSHLSLANQLMLLTISMLMLVPLSYDYRLLWLLPVFAIWLASEANSKFRWHLVVAFGVLFAARPIYFVTERMTVGSMMTFPLLLTILVAILYGALVDQESSIEERFVKDETF